MLKAFMLMVFLSVAPLSASEEKPPKLVLYMSPNCPYCQRVLWVVNSVNLDVEVKDTSIPENKEYLVARTNRATVPCLFIDDQPMFESKVIMKYLKEK